MIADPAAKIAEYVEHRTSASDRLVAALDRGERSRQSACCARSGTTCPSQLLPAAAYVMQAHLEKLEAEGRLPERPYRLASRQRPPDMKGRWQWT